MHPRRQLGMSSWWPAVGRRAVGRQPGASLLLDAAAHSDALRGDAANESMHVRALLRLPRQLGVLRVVVYLQGYRMAANLVPWVRS